MKKHLSLILLPMISSVAIPAVSTFTSCSKESNFTYKFDEHVKGFSISEWRSYQSFTLDCTIEDGYQISEAKFEIENLGEVEQKYLTISKNKVVVDSSVPTTDQKVTITIKCSQVQALHVVINNNKFIVDQTILDINTDTDLVVMPTSNTYSDKGNVHDMTTVHGDFSLYKGANLVKTIQFTGSTDKKYTLPVNSFVREWTKGEIDNIVVNLKFAKIAFTNPWEVFADISNQATGLTTALATFNPGDYVDLYFEEIETHHDVRITGMGIDTKADGSGYATFTFEFVNVVCDSSWTLSDGRRISAWSTASSNADYATCTLNNTINEDQTNKAFKPMLISSLGTYAANIKTITRNYLQWQSSSYKNNTFQAEVFVPGLKNIMTDDGIESWDYVTSTDKPKLKLETNKQYQFYKNEIGNGDYVTSIKNNIFIRKYMSTNTKYYATWIATPYVGNSTDAMLFSDSRCKESCDTKAISFAPCFCF